MLTYSHIENAILAWAQGRPDILGLVVVGSRINAEADDLADLDMVVFTPNVGAYSASADWLAGIGPLWLLTRESDPSPEWYAIFEGALKVDVLIHAVRALSLADELVESPHRDGFARGVRVLLDRYPESATVMTTHYSPPPLTASTFSLLVGQFLLNALRAAKYLLRDDLWRAAHVMDCRMRRQLLMLMEWHTQTHSHADTWYDGRNLAQWLDAEYQRDLPKLFAHYTPADLRAALLAHVEIAHRLTDSIRAEKSFHAPDFDPIEAWIQHRFHQAAR